MKLKSLFLCLPLVLAACAEDKDEAPPYDEALLAQYRAALPSRDRMTATDPSNGSRAVGDAAYPNIMKPGVQAINGVVLGMLDILEHVVSLPPTIYDSAEQKFAWGPFTPNDGTYGQVLVYIQKNPDYGADPSNPGFEYGYAFIRLDSNDTATWAPVVWGGGTPGADADHGYGVTLWDFEANNAWEACRNPNYDPVSARDHGRFVAFYANIDDTTNNASLAFNVAMFRNFISKDNPSSQSVDADYLWGLYTGPDGNHMTFVDWQATADVCDPSSGSPVCFDQATLQDQDELTGIRLAFFNNGMGRAEATVSGGDLGGTVITAVECWDALLESNYLEFNDGTNSYLVHGQATNCGSWFGQTLDQMGVWSIAMLRNGTDHSLYDGMNTIATNGIAPPMTCN